MTPNGRVDSFIVRIVQDLTHEQTPCRIWIRHVQSGLCRATTTLASAGEVMQQLLRQAESEAASLRENSAEVRRD